MSKEVSKWADTSMFTAEKSDAAAGPVAFLLGAPVDPLGQIAACAKMYKGEVVRDLADVTDEERREYLEQIQKTVLKMPLEAVSLHFMLEGVHRGITHQMVRQRTGAYAQESTRFAVKEDLASATALPPSLMDTLPWEEWEKVARKMAQDQGLDLQSSFTEGELRDYALNKASKQQIQRMHWDEAVSEIDFVYNELINDGMPAEEARGLMPTNITTRLNYITNLRSFYDTIAVRVSDQAQFEWRKVAGAYALAMRAYGDTNRYDVWVKQDDPDGINLTTDISRGVFKKVDGIEYELVRRSSSWQYDALTAEMKPIEFKIGGPAFGANFDRPSRIGERVAAFHAMGVPSSRWIEGAPEHTIPGISPDEWLLDPNSARLAADMEFDIYGNRVRAGSGEHWHIVPGKGGLITTGIPAFKE